MADISDVESALVSLVSSAIYPSGVGSPSAVGIPCRIYRGWPNAAKLNEDLKNRRGNVSAFPEDGGHNTTRFPRVWSNPVVSVPTLTVATAEPVVTFGGTGGAGQVAGIRTNSGAWAYAVQATDTPATVAAALAALVPGAVATGSAVGVAPSAGLLGRVVGTGVSLMEVRRQIRSVRITLWFPDTASRDQAGKLLDAALGSVSWLALADGTAGRLIYRWDATNDVVTKDALWRRDFRYDVEYGTTVQQQFVEMLFGGGTILSNGGVGLADFGDVQPATELLTTPDELSVYQDGAGNLIGVSP